MKKNIEKLNTKSRINAINNEKGITLTTLVVTIIVLLILAGIATYSGIEAIDNTKRTKFISELKIMQSHVNQWYEDCKPSSTENWTDKTATKFTNTGAIKIKVEQNQSSDTTSKIQKAQETLTAAGITSNQDHFYLLESSQKSALGIEGVEQDVLVSVQDRKVVSYLGLKYKDNMYYTIDSLDGENGIDAIYNVGYENPNKNPPSILVTGRSVYNGETAKGAKYKFTVDVTQGSRYINKGDLYYGKIENGEVKNWNKTEDKSFIVDREGTYKIYYKDAAGNESETISYEIKPHATLKSGIEFCKAMKLVSGDSNANSTTINTSIKYFKISSVAPSSTNMLQKVSIEVPQNADPNEYKDVVIWFDGIDTIWCYSEENWININSVSQDMFRGLSSILNIDLNNFETSQVVNMANMFYGCANLTKLDLSNFNTINVTNMAGMFSGCKCLTKLDLSSFNTSKVTNMHDMFASCNQMKILDLSGFSNENLTVLGNMFWNCNEITTIFASEKFNLSDFSVNKIFTGCRKLVGGSGTIYDVNHVYADYAHIDNGPSNPGYFTEKSNI